MPSPTLTSTISGDEPPLRDLPAGAAVMLDANMLVYALTPQSQFHASCVALLERGASSTLSLFTSVSVTADVLNRAMVLELLAQGQTQRSAEAVALLKQRPDLVQQLTRYRTILRDLRQARVDILPSRTATSTPAAPSVSSTA